VRRWEMGSMRPCKLTPCPPP